MQKQPETFWAWLAGFIDGDGTVGCYSTKGSAQPLPSIRIAQKDPAVLAWIVDKLGTGSVQRLQGGYCDTHQLAFGSKASRQVAAKIASYLQVAKKRHMAESFATFEPKPRGKPSHERPEFQKAVELYAQGRSCKDIAATLGVKAATINYWLRSRGLTRTYQQAQQLRRKKEAA